MKKAILSVAFMLFLTVGANSSVKKANISPVMGCGAAAAAMYQEMISAGHGAGTAAAEAQVVFDVCMMNYY